MHNEHNIEMDRNAHVEVVKHDNGNGKYQAGLIINDRPEIILPQTSRVSKALELYAPADVASRLTGGQYFYVDGQLVDFRDGDYNGFVHDDTALQALLHVLGISTSSKTLKHGNTLSKSIVLGREWSTEGLEVPQIGEGLAHSSSLSFVWSPFSDKINSVLNILRLICSNGMTATTRFLNTQIPIINRWEEHMDIAARLIQNKVQGMVKDRLGQMVTEQASVSELQLIAEHARKRMNNVSVPHTEEVRTRLTNILNTVDPTRHLSDVYSPAVFGNKSLAAAKPGHLSVYDAYNITTELSTHTPATDDSTQKALDNHANWMMFNRKDIVPMLGVERQALTTEYSDPNTAFFGGVKPTEA